MHRRGDYLLEALEARLFLSGDGIPELHPPLMSSPAHASSAGEIVPLAETNPIEPAEAAEPLSSIFPPAEDWILAVGPELAGAPAEDDESKGPEKSVNSGGEATPVTLGVPPVLADTTLLPKSSLPVAPSVADDLVETLHAANGPPTRIALAGPVVNAGTNPVWIEQGPSKIENPDGSTAIGAINLVVPHPGEPPSVNTMFAGTVNGGVWVTEDFQTASPTWRPLTDHLPSLAISALAVSSFTASGASMSGAALSDLVLYAGTGSLSSRGFEGGSAAGVWRSSNGGSTWLPLKSGQDTLLVGQTITSIAFSNTDSRSIVVSYAEPTWFRTGGIKWTNDGGTTWKDPTTALPAGAVWDVTFDPDYLLGGDKDRYFAAMTTGDAATSGVYVSEDGGDSWTLTATQPTTGAALGGAQRIRLTMSSDASEPLYAAVMAAGASLLGVYRTLDNGNSWTPVGSFATAPTLDVRMFSLAATGSNGVYIGGSGGDNLLRWDAGSGTWKAISPAAGGSSPHADSRSLTVLRDSDLVETDDGGIYVLTDGLETNSWVAKNGNLRIAEIGSSIAVDSGNDRILAGTQDNGVLWQKTNLLTSAGSAPAWFNQTSGDGNYVAVRPSNSHYG